MKKRNSIGTKLILIFGLLILFAIFALSFMALRIAQKAVIEKVSAHLIDKANDVAEIIDARETSLFQFLQGIARIPQLRDPSLSIADKGDCLHIEAEANSLINELDYCDLNGYRHNRYGTPNYIGDLSFFKKALSGKPGISEPFTSRLNNKFVIMCALPVFDNNKNVISVILAELDGNTISNDIANIVVGETGEVFILGETGNAIAHKNHKIVENAYNPETEAKKDPAFASLAKFAAKALAADKSEVGYYEYMGVTYIASYAPLKTNNWTVFIKAPLNEFMGSIAVLRFMIVLYGIIIFIVSLVTVYITAKKIIKPIKIAVAALQDIAQGEGDLTVRLPVTGNDEITGLSEYFNQTIEKIGVSIKAVETNSSIMESVGENLSSNMAETASAINEISSNIDSVKQQTLNQAASVTQTAGTIKEIIETIGQLNDSIENQSASVVQSSASIEEMVSNIASITKSLEKSDNLVKTLAEATSEGKNTLISSNAVTQRIAEESGGLIEASNVIQHIASQTNLLAMNAAIEAAHAGEAGKGFAVVADEIRKLAEESSMHGKTITETLKKLSDEITGLADSSRIVEEKFNAIFSLSENVRGMSSELTSAMIEQENGSREVLAAIKNISAVTSEVKEGSAQMLTGGNGVAQEMHKLDELTTVIKNSMNEMAIGVTHINHAVQEVNELAKENQASIENLSSEVKKFKI